MITRTSTENTKVIDEIFNFDLSRYRNSKVKSKHISISHKAFCNNCGSDDCQIIRVIKNEK